ncbi:hypothetical protein BK026_12005 [Alteromonas sp. V450]|uniref:hypothetical protein n=1 Tax=Alteromonas sp. V450 TaxID=1912139 RepID=UPI0008FF55C1|nr:hypothetical protein [Alteromonas sp. V450]OJF69451.1 hypothetical protein BK026_12005 [Alteromonas sp. V450]
MKICLCVSGQFRNIDRCVENINNFVDSLELKHPQAKFDIYIDTWEEQGSTSDFTRLLPDEFTQFMPIALNRNDRAKTQDSNISALLPFVNRLVDEVSDNTPVTQKKLKDIKYFCDAKIEPYKQFEESNQQLFKLVDSLNLPRGMLPMFYKIHSCLELTKKFAINYDRYIRIRPDQKIMLSAFEPEDILTAPLSILFHPAYSRGRFSSDQFAVGDSRNFGRYCSVWQYLEQYLTNEIHLLSPNLLNPESLVYEHLSYFDVSWRNIFHRPYPHFIGGKVLKESFFPEIIRLVAEGEYHEALESCIDQSLYFNQISDDRIELDNISEAIAKSKFRLKLLKSHMEHDVLNEYEILSELLQSKNNISKSANFAAEQRLAKLSQMLPG